MSTSTLSVALPPAFVQVIINISGDAVIVIDLVPLVFSVPDQLLDATQDVAAVDVHERFTAVPLETVTGPSELFALNINRGQNHARLR